MKEEGGHIPKEKNVVEKCESKNLHIYFKIKLVGEIFG
jgi:hypothetical protein